MRVTGNERPDFPSESADSIVGTYQPFVSADGVLVFQAFVLSASVDETTLVASAEAILPDSKRNMRSDPLGANTTWVFNGTGRVNNKVVEDIHTKAAAAFAERYPNVDSLVICDNLASHRQPELLQKLLQEFGQTYLFTPPNLTHIYGICDDVLFASLSNAFGRHRNKISYERSLLGKNYKYGMYVTSDVK